MVEPISQEAIERLQREFQDQAEKSKLQATSSPLNGQRLDVRAYLSKYGIEVVKEKANANSTLYCLKHCVFDPSHAGNEAAIGQTSDGKLFYQCFHNSCQDRTWAEARKLISGDDPLFEKEYDKSTGSKANDNGNKKKESQSQLLLKITKDIPLFHDSENNVYAAPVIKNIAEFIDIQSRIFRSYLSHKLYKKTNIAPYSEAVKQAISILSAKGMFESPEISADIRIGKLKDCIYLDVGDKQRNVIEITKDDWAIAKKPPVYFRRPKGFLALQMPEPGGNISDLKHFLNVKSDADFLLIIGWLVQALNPEGPYPILVINGEQGTAKSTLSRLLRALIDPNMAPLRSSPRSDRDLAIQCTNSWIQVIENVSYIPEWLSNALCRLSTGGGFSTRQLYENSEESLFSYKRPLIINGISNFISKQDLLDRALVITLEPISEELRRPESEINKEFDKAAPYLTGALLDAVSAALKNIEDVKLEKLPRMADFARWVVAAEPGLPWSPGGFMNAYAAERSRCIQEAIENSPVGSAIQKLMEDRNQWSGLATELLTELEELVDDKIKNQKQWPKNSRWLHTRIRETSSFMRKAGIEIVNKRKERGSFFKIRKNSVSNVSSVNKEEKQRVTPDAIPDAINNPDAKEKYSVRKYDEFNQADTTNPVTTDANVAKKHTSKKEELKRQYSLEV